MDATKLGIALLALCPITLMAQQPADDPSAEETPAESPPVQSRPALNPAEEYASLLRETRGLEEYNALRQRQINQQGQDLVRLQTAYEGVPTVELQLPPLLIRMVDGLREFVNLDFPLLNEQRTERVNNLYALIEDSSQSDAVKLRRILEAWAIEVEYGGEFHTFEGKLPVGNPERDVDFVAIGRVGLLYQTRDDEALTGAWDYRTGSWVELGTEHRNSVRQAIRMARNQIAPELVLLPTVPPQND